MDVLTSRTRRCGTRRRGAVLALVLGAAAVGWGEPRRDDAIPATAGAADPACQLDGCLRAVVFRGHFDKARLVPYLAKGVTIDNGYSVYSLTFLTGGRESRATVTVPYPLAPPAGGFHIVANNHGTSGLDDPCAVAGTMAGVGLAGLFGARGMIGVATDYPGLGTPGLHPYLVAEIEGHAALDGLRAARQLVRDLGVPISRRFAMVGLSQGGHATLAAAARHRAYAPDLDIRAFAVAAPASAWEEHWRTAARYDGWHLVYHAMLIYAWADYYKFAGAPLWADGVTAIIDREMHGYCAWSPRDEPPLTRRLPQKGAELFSPAFLAAYRSGNWGVYSRFHDWFTANRIGPYDQTAPLRVYQGTFDLAVPAAATSEMVNALRKGGGSRSSLSWCRGRATSTPPLASSAPRSSAPRSRSPGCAATSIASRSRP